MPHLRWCRILQSKENRESAVDKILLCRWPDPGLVDLTVAELSDQINDALWIGDASHAAANS